MFSDIKQIHSYKHVIAEELPWCNLVVCNCINDSEQVHLFLYLIKVKHYTFSIYIFNKWTCFLRIDICILYYLYFVCPHVHIYILWVIYIACRKSDFTLWHTAHFLFKVWINNTFSLTWYLFRKWQVCKF